MTGRRILIAVLLAGALGVRLWHLHLARFTGDEAHQWAMTLDLVRLNHFPLLGVDVTGGPARHPGPLLFWVYAPALWFSAHPLAMSVWTALAHVGLVAAFSAMVGRIRGPNGGLWALAVGALAPWELLYADRPWASNMAPVWAGAGLYLTAHARSSRWAGPAAFFFLVTLPQFHLSAPLAWAAAAVVSIWGIPELERVRTLRPEPGSRGCWLPWALFGGLAVAAYLPAAIHELGPEPSNVALLLSRAGGALTGAEALREGTTLAGYAVLYGSPEIGFHFRQGFWNRFDPSGHYLTLNGWSQRWSERGPWITALEALGIGFSAAAWLYLVVRLIRNLLRGGFDPRASGPRRLDGTDVWTLALGAALAVGALGIVRSGKWFYPHYANILIPYLLLPIVVLFDGLWRRPRWRGVAGLAFVAWAGAGLYNVHAFYVTRDGLHGVGPTTCLVGRAVEEPGLRLWFRYRDNRYAWSRLAHHYFGRPLRLDDRSQTRVMIENYAPDWSATCAPVAAPGLTEPWR